MNTEITKKPLTEIQSEVFEKIKSIHDGFLKPHRKPNNDVAWKLMDSEHRPIRIYGNGVINKLIEKEYLIKQGSVIIIK